MSGLLGQLPDWSASQEPGPGPDYGPALEAARELALGAWDERRAAVERVARESCLPRFELARASGLYVVLRLLFELPTAYPLAETKVFGGWVHPSIGQDPFDLSWPVRVDPAGRTFAVADFRGYRGKGYDALGEYDYFAGLFAARPPELLGELSALPG